MGWQMYGGITASPTQGCVSVVGGVDEGALMVVPEGEEVIQEPEGVGEGGEDWRTARVTVFVTD